MWGQKPFVLIWDSQYPVYVKDILEKVNKTCVIVDQVSFNDDKENDNDIIEREITQIISRGTYTDLLDTTDDYNDRYLMSIIESQTDYSFGIALVEATTHKIFFDEIQNDKAGNQLRTILRKYNPVEIHSKRNNLSENTKNLCKTICRPQFTFDEVNNQFSTLESIFSDIKQEFQNKMDNYPPVLKKIEDFITNKKQNQEQTIEEYNTEYFMLLQALHLLLNYLKYLKLNENVFQMSNFKFLDENTLKKNYLVLDSHAIENLDIFEVNQITKITEEGSLLNFLDYTRTKSGKRMLKKWLMYPLNNINQILERQQAIQEMENNFKLFEEFTKKASVLGDIERQLSKIFNSSQISRLNPSSFDNFSHQRLKESFLLIKNLKIINENFQKFNQANFQSNKLKQLTKNLPFEQIFQFIQSIENQVCQDEQGMCFPKPGIDPQYDEILKKIEQIKDEMNEEVNYWRKRMKNLDIKLIKSRMQYELQFPEHLVQGNLKPQELTLTSKIKGYQRFQTDKLLSLLKQIKLEEINIQKALTPFCQQYFHQFHIHREQIYQIINSISEIDCLFSLWQNGKNLTYKCFPTFTLNKAFQLKGMLHPQLIKYKNKNMVANDTVFSKNINALLITGPNMGGKSTLLRQTCLAVILAQIGAFVPAEKFVLQVKDRIFCRVGASDSLIEGKSTFQIEMEETRDIVLESSENSIVIIDELGRGTSTYDGICIAYSVLKYLVENIKCLCLFSTHYHMLVDEFQLYDNIENYFMNYYYDEAEKSIHFQYKFVKGISSKSFAVHVAKIAGLPIEIINRAGQVEKIVSEEDQKLSNIVLVNKKFNILIQEIQSLEKNLLQ